MQRWCPRAIVQPPRAGMGTGINGWGEKSPLASAECPEEHWQARGGEKRGRDVVKTTRRSKNIPKDKYRGKQVPHCKADNVRLLLCDRDVIFKFNTNFHNSA